MRRAVSLSGAAFALLCIVLILFVLPAGAQDSDGIPPGTPANGVDTSNTNAPPDVILVAAEDCTVSPGASITLEDGDGTQGTFTDGERGITITEQNGSPRIEGPPGDFVGNHATFPTSDTAFDTDGDYSVVSSTGITCAGGGAAPEDTTPAEDQYTLGPDTECPGAQLVNTTTGTGNKQSAPFQITGDRFRITVTNNPTSSPSLSGVSVFVVNADSNQDVTSFDKEGAGQESSIVNRGPGTFYLDILAANAKYTVTVEDCTGMTAPPGKKLPPVNNSKGVIPGTGVKKMPPTGGPPLAIGALALLAAAVIAGRGILRP